MKFALTLCTTKLQLLFNMYVLKNQQKKKEREREREKSEWYIYRTWEERCESVECSYLLVMRMFQNSHTDRFFNFHPQTSIVYTTHICVCIVYMWVRWWWWWFVGLYHPCIFCSNYIPKLNCTLPVWLCKCGCAYNQKIQ